MGGWEGTHFVDEQHAGHQLRDPLVDVPVHDLVDLHPQLLRDLRLLGLHQLAHHAHDVLPALRPRVRHVQIVQRDVLHNLLLLVHIPLRDRHVLLRLEVELGGIGVGPPDPFHRARVRLDVDDVAEAHALLLDRFVDGWVQAQLLGAAVGFQRYEEVCDCAAVAAERVFGFFGRQLGDFAFVDLFCFAHAETWVATVLALCAHSICTRKSCPPGGRCGHASRTYRTPKVLHERLRLLDLGGIYLAAHDRTEWHLGSQLLRHRQRQRRLPCAWSASQQHRPARHLLRTDEVDDYAACLLDSSIAG